MADQLTLIDAVLPQKRRIGVVATAESEPMVRELQRAAQGWDVHIEYAPDAKSLAAALRAVVPLSDALMVLPDLIGDNQAATLSVLRAGAGAGLPVFGASEGLVRSGGLAAAVSTPCQLAQQARVLGQKVAAAPARHRRAGGGGDAGHRARQYHRGTRARPAHSGRTGTDRAGRGHPMTAPSHAGRPASAARRGPARDGRPHPRGRRQPAGRPVPAGRGALRGGGARAHRLVHPQPARRRSKPSSMPRARPWRARWRPCPT